MKFRFLIHEALQSLRSNILRSLLTIIGIVVGIFSVTAMLALGEGLSANVLERFNSFFQGDLTVSGELTLTDLTWMREQPFVNYVLGSVQVREAEVVVASTDFSPTIQTVIGDYPEIQKFSIVSGKTFDFNDQAYNEQVAVVSNGFADRVLEETGQRVQDQAITVNGIKYTVIGVIESTSMLFTRGDGIILLPYSTVVGSLSSSKNFSSVALLLKDSSYYKVAGENILGALNASHELALDSEDLFSVETSETFIETAEQTTTMISLFLGIVGGIALFVGGIGTMNMMLTTVTERTKEIGLRKAVGARNRDILLQILVESVTLTTFGGIVGILLSLGVARIANEIFADSEIIRVLVNLNVVLWAAFVSFAVGIVFGIYPAQRASKLQPVDALRAE